MYMMKSDVYESNDVDRRYFSKISFRKQISEEVFVIGLERKALEFVPGQNISIGIGSEYFRTRDYTICSGINESRIDIFIRKYPNGAVSSKLVNLPVGHLINFSGPYGEFRIENLDQEHVFLAGGVGISPFRSFVLSYPGLKYKCFHGIRTIKEAALSEGINRDYYFSCVSRESEGDYKGHLTTYLKKAQINKNATFFICGNSTHAKALERILKEKGIREQAIKKEIYYL